MRDSAEKQPTESDCSIAESDALWVRAGIAGDKDAFARLVERYHRKILGLATILTSDTYAAEDIAQETFLRAFRSLKSCAQPHRFEAWLTGIARNAAREWRRSRKHSSHLVEDLPDEAMPTLTGIAALEEREARLAALERALTRLPTEQREIITLKYQKNKTCAEIALQLNKKTNTVAKALSRAYEQLEQGISRSEQTP